MGKGKKRWTGAEKLRIVLLGLQTSVNVSELCRREGLTANQFYEWKKQLLSSSETVFGKRESKLGSREERLEQENVRLKSVIAEITTENLDLKKTFGD
jgi:transposase-like protein